MTNLTHYEAISRILREAGRPLKEKFGNIAPIKQKDAVDSTTVVTELDIATEEHIKAALQTYDSTIEFYGEESGGNKDADRFWLLDPIDGTGAFARGWEICTTMLVLIEHDQPTASAIYDFVRDELYYAEAGKGAYKNGEPIHVSDRPLKSAYLQVESRNNATLTRIRETAPASFNMPASGYEYALIASGKLDGKIVSEAWGDIYDYAPGCLLVTEAGGIATNIGSTTYDYKNCNCIAANPIVHKALTEGPNALFPVTK